MPSERPFDRLPHMGIDRRPSRDFYHSLVASKRTIPAGTSAELPAVLFVRWEPWMIHPHGASSPFFFLSCSLIPPFQTISPANFVGFLFHPWVPFPHFPSLPCFPTPSFFLPTLYSFFYS